MEQNEQPHKRRVRYSGTHPKNYKEKYKELNPEKYGDTISHVMEKGNTPAGMHISICVNEILEVLAIRPGEQGFDATLGYGGHTLEMLKQLDHTGLLCATDEDPIELPKTTKRLLDAGFGPEYFRPYHMNFCNIGQIASEHGGFDFILADLGVSSMQIDNPDRGFSFKFHAPLDLRLNPDKGEPASERINDMTQDEIACMLEENADEPMADAIAKSIVSARRKGQSIETTTDYRLLIEAALGKATPEEVKKTCQRCFQALRIDVNQEYEVLYEFLEQLPDAARPGGRIAILTFHSGEDRLVKKAFQRGKKAGVFSSISEEPIKPTPDECARNARARSAKLRFAIRNN